MSTMRFACPVLVAATLLSLPGAASEPAARPSAPGVSFVIGSGYEAFFLDALTPGKGAGGWTLEGVSLERDRAVARYARRGGTVVTVYLEHPDRPGAGAVATARFRVRHEGGDRGAAALVRHLAARLKARERVFQWRADVPAVARPGFVPTVPQDGLPAALLAEPTWDLASDAALARWDAALKALAGGDVPAAVAAARELAADSPLAAASLLRRAGDPAGAVAILERGVAPGAASGSTRRDEDRALSLLLAGREADAERLLAGDPEPACRKAALWTRAIREGRAADVQRLAGPLLAGATAPRCLHLLRMRLAIARADEAALEAAGRAAMDQLGRDDDLLFLWGRYYFGDFYNPESLRKATVPWGRLSRANPRYATILGLYATAEVQSGGLDREKSFAYLAAWQRDPKDVVSAFLAGVGMHYLREFEPSIPPLEAAYAAVPEEPRTGMYLAMAYYFTRRQEQAERVLEAIAQYAYQEPDIYYCRSSVLRHKDPEASAREMALFLSVMEEEGRFCFDPGKPARARKDLEALRRGEIPPVRLPNSDQEVRP